MSGPKCIVCGKPIAKKTTAWYIRESRPKREAIFRESCGRMIEHFPYDAGRAHGVIERTHYSVTIYLDEDKLPRTKQDCARLCNEQIVSTKRHYGGKTISSFTTWDGESYTDPYFHSQQCAAKQGYASAGNGHRFDWHKAVDEQEESS